MSVNVFQMSYAVNERIFISIQSINQSIINCARHSETNKCKLRKKMHSDQLPVKQYAYLCWPPIMNQHAD